MIKYHGLLVQVRTSYIHIDIRGTEPQLGQYYMAEYAKTAGFVVKVKSYSSNDPIIQSLKKIISEHDCKVVGFYVDSENIWTISRTTMILHNIFPDLFITIGGPQVTGDPHLAMKRIPFSNCAIIGEGERPFCEILKFISSNDSTLSQIDGLLFRSPTGEIIQTKNQTDISDLDFYPFPRRYEHTLDEDVVFDQISTGRGCIGKCAFCFEGNKKSNRLRLRSIESVLEEIDYVISHLNKTNYLSFLDDTFILNSDRAITICNHLISKHQGKIGWFCEGRVDILYHHLDLLPLIKKAGNIRIQLGGESGNQNILNIYNKKMKLHELETVVRAIYECGISSTYINFIIGGAYENIDTFKETLDFAKKLLNIAPGCAEVGCSLLTPYVGTPIRKFPNQYGITIIDSDIVTGPDGFIPTVETQLLTSKKISQLKSIFDSEIKAEYKKILLTLPNEKLFHIYTLNKKYNMATDWYMNSNEYETFKNYFEPQIKYGFTEYTSLRGNEAIQMAVPYRTIQPISDGVRYYALYDGINQLKLEDMMEDVFLLCSGKLSYFEIISILKKKYGNNEDVENEIDRIFNLFEKHKLVVWKWLF